METQSWMDAANDVDQSTVEVSGPEYPWVQWCNGQKALKAAGGVVYTGGWFLGEMQAGGTAPAAWTAGTLTHRDGAETAGYFCRDITVAVVRMRRAWIVNGDRYPWDQYDAAVRLGSPKGKLQVLVQVQGWEHLVVLTLSGTVCAAFQGTRKAEGVLTRFNRVVVAEANALNTKRGVKARFPYRAFWLTVGPQRDEKGTPVYSEVGKPPNTSFVTLPAALGLPDKVQPGDLAKLFVGADVLTRLSAAYTDAETWAHAWDAVSVAATEVVADAPANGEEDSLPF